MKFNAILCWGVAASVLLIAEPGTAEDGSRKPQTLELSAKDTATVAQMNRGDELRFRLQNGAVRTFVLEDVSARVVERVGGGVLYSFECRVLADGQPLTLRRFVCSQETFYEPWVVNGVRIWFSSSSSIFKLVPIRYPEQHDKLEADAVFVVQDATLPICPQNMQPWFPIERHFIDVGECYNGDDPWLGPYLGQACHMGLDINMPKGTPLTSPLDFDTQWIFSADHRWRGVRRWENGDIWGLQSHHVNKLLIDEDTPLKAGTHYAEAAGKGIGSHQHSHFEFRVGEGVLNRGQLGGTELDPWILFWQIFENDKESRGEIRATIEPLSPAITGKPVRFSAEGSRAGTNTETLRHIWTFGDGGSSRDASPQHTFLRPGVYPVTLVVDDGRQRATRTQHITVSGEDVESPALILEAVENVTFQRRPSSAADVYGWPVKFLPHTVRLSVAPKTAVLPAEVVLLKYAGGGTLSTANEPVVQSIGPAAGWLRLNRIGEGDTQRIEVAADPRGLPEGRYEATVLVTCPGAVNEMQAFGVELTVRSSPDAREVIVDDRDDAFFATPFFWVGHQFLRMPGKGFQRRYLTNGSQPDAHAIVRFTPDLAAGRYEVLFHRQTPFVDADFPVRIRHASGEAAVSFTSNETGERSLGTYEFAEGTGGFVEIGAKGSRGKVVVDAVVFRRVDSE